MNTNQINGAPPIHCPDYRDEVMWTPPRPWQQDDLPIVIFGPYTRDNGASIVVCKRLQDIVDDGDLFDLDRQDGLNYQRNLAHSNNLSPYYIPGLDNLLKELGAYIKARVDRGEPLRPQLDVLTNVFKAHDYCLKCIQNHERNMENIHQLKKLYGQSTAQVRKSVRSFFTKVMCLALYLRRWKGPGRRFPTALDFTRDQSQEFPLGSADTIPLSEYLANRGIVLLQYQGDRGLEVVEGDLIVEIMALYNNFPPNLRERISLLPGVYRHSMTNEVIPLTVMDPSTPNINADGDSGGEEFPFHRTSDGNLFTCTQNNGTCVRMASGVLVKTAGFYWQALKLGTVHAHLRQPDGSTILDVLGDFQNIQ
jgi:hypothetical protein